MIQIPDTHKSAALLVTSAVVAYLLIDFLLILFITFLLVTAFLPLVRLLRARKIPKSVSSIILVLAIFVLPIGLIINIGPDIASQTQDLVESAPALLDTLEDETGLAVPEGASQSISNQLSQAGGYIFSISSTLLTIVVSVVAIIVLTVYGLVYYDETSRDLIGFFAKNKQQKQHYNRLLNTIENRLGTWFKGQLIICLLIGTLSWLAYILLDLPFAGTLAILAGVFELLPGIGPTLAAIPALIVALTVSPQTFFFTLIAYLFIQFVESYLVTPRIMSRVIKLNPFITMVVVLTGTFLLGILGAFLAIPLALFATEIYKAYYSKE